MQDVARSLHDALIARAAESVKAKKLLTLNAPHLLRVWPEGKGVVASS